MSVDETQKLVPEIDMKVMLEVLSPNYQIKRVIVTSPSYLKEFSSILSDTPSETLQGYFIWKTVQSLVEYLDAPALTPLKRFTNELAGKVCILRPKIIFI